MRNRSYGRNQTGLATWLKWVIGFVVAGTLLSMAACGIIGFTAYSTMKDMMSPISVKEKMAKIVDAEIPFDRYEPYMCLDIPFVPLTISSVNDKQTKLTFMLIKAPNKENQTNEQLLEQFAATGVPTATTSGQASMQVSIASKGKTKVGGQEMAYLLGTTNSEQGVQPVYLGLILPRPNEATLVCSIGEAGKQIDLAQVDEFLGKIKAFK